jgi:hypothetical protein
LGEVTLSHDSIPAGVSSVLLSWDSEGADEAWIDPGIGRVDITGSKLL